MRIDCIHNILKNENNRKILVKKLLKTKKADNIRKSYSKLGN